jgi:hypothetical protein
MTGCGGKAHNWANKTHTRSFIDGFQLYPTAKIFIVSDIVAMLASKIKSVSANRLERFVKEELQKQGFVDTLMVHMRE